jgi:hypothetical protein
MPDRLNLRRVFDQAVPLVLLTVAGVALVYAVSVAVTLQELRSLEPIIHPDFEGWRCPPAAGSGPATDGDGAAAPQHPAAAERSAICPPASRQLRPH